MYLVTWIGRVTGSTAGRDDGYPEEKHSIISESQLPDYYKLPDFKCYIIKQINPNLIVEKEIRLRKEKEVLIQQKKAVALNKLSVEEKRILGIKR